MPGMSVGTSPVTFRPSVPVSLVNLGNGTIYVDTIPPNPGTSPPITENGSMNLDGTTTYYLLSDANGPYQVIWLQGMSQYIGGSVQGPQTVLTGFQSITAAGALNPYTFGPIDVAGASYVIIQDFVASGTPQNRTFSIAWQDGKGNNIGLATGYTWNRWAGSAQTIATHVLAVQGPTMYITMYNGTAGVYEVEIEANIITTPADINQLFPAQVVLDQQSVTIPASGSTGIMYPSKILPAGLYRVWYNTNVQAVGRIIFPHSPSLATYTSDYLAQFDLLASGISGSDANVDIVLPGDDWGLSITNQTATAGAGFMTMTGPM